MRRRGVFLRLVLLAFAATAVWAGPAQPAPARSGTAAATPYSASRVVKAFRSVGIKLFDTGYGTLDPVTTLAEVHARPGWTLGVLVYPTEAKGTQSFNSNIGQWRASGFAASRAKNVIATAVPKGRLLGKKAPPFPMPQVVANGLAALTRG